MSSLLKIVLTPPSNSNDYLDLSKLTFDKENEGPKQDDPLAENDNQRRSIHP